MEQNNIYQLVFKVTHAGGSGSCFYLKDYDLFVTNYHVVKGFHSLACTTMTGILIWLKWCW